jgi:hypothetical protein
MKKEFFRRILCLQLIVLLILSVSSGFAYDVYKNSQDMTPVPDVNKNPANPQPDNSCWLAVAANLLGGAGWGLSTQTAQQNADAIYGQLVNHFGVNFGGLEERAVNWWLLNYGYNPNAPDLQYYNPTKQYNDVTHVNRTLVAADYDFLLDELTRCQYVGVSFAIPGQELGHAMTLVGGNYSQWHMPPGMQQQSVWHDSDRNNIAPGDDVYTNRWQGSDPTATWYVDYQNTPANPNDDLLAENYTTLCPGLQKPKVAIDNYDVAFYRDMDPAGNWIRTFREAGAKKDVYADPYWDTNYVSLVIGNEFIPEYHKSIYLLIDYLDRDNNADPGITLITPQDQNGLAPTSIQYSPDFGQILLTWDLTYQPDWEKIVFPNVSYYDLSGDVKDFNIATYCVPEPGMIMLVVIGGLSLIRQRRRV